MDTLIGYVIVVVIALAVPSIIIGLTFVALRDERSKWYWLSLRFVLLTGYIWFVGRFLGGIKAMYQLEIYQREHRLFWGLFENALAEYPDFKSAVAAMLTPEIHQAVMEYIGANVWPYLAAGLLLICVGGVVLLLSWLMMLCLRNWKYRAWAVALSLAVGLALFGYGNYELGFGRGTETRLKVEFRGQEFGMKELALKNTTISNAAIISLMREHVAKRGNFISLRYVIISKLEEKPKKQD